MPMAPQFKVGDLVVLKSHPKKGGRIVKVSPTVNTVKVWVVYHGMPETVTRQFHINALIKVDETGMPI